MACSSARPWRSTRVYGTPFNAILAQSAWSVLLVLSGSFSQLIIYTGFSVVLFSGIAGVALFVLRQRHPDEPRPFRAWGYPLMPGLFVLASALIVGNAIWRDPGPSAAGLGIIAAGLPLYLYLRRQYVGRNFVPPELQCRQRRSLVGLRSYNVGRSTSRRRTTSPTRIVPGCTTRALIPRRLSARPTGELTNFIASSPKRATNLLHPVCGSGRDLDHRRADGQTRAGRQVLAAQIEIDVQLIAGQGPALGVLRDQRRGAHVHHIELHLRMRPAIDAARAAAPAPRVADQPLDQIELALPAAPRARPRPAAAR